MRLVSSWNFVGSLEINLIADVSPATLSNLVEV